MPPDQLDASPAWRPRDSAARMRDTPQSRDSAGARKLEFAAFVRRSLDTARVAKAWNGSEVARRTGLSRQTINRWLRGDWTTDPEPERVVAFCAGLGIDASTAFTALGWDRSTSAANDTVDLSSIDPDVAALMRRLADPAISTAEKFHIRETIRYLAYRPPLPAQFDGPATTSPAEFAS